MLCDELLDLAMLLPAVRLPVAGTSRILAANS